MSDTDICQNCGHHRRAHNRDRGHCNANVTGPHFCHCARFRKTLRAGEELRELQDRWAQQKKNGQWWPGREE